SLVPGLALIHWTGLVTRPALGPSGPLLHRQVVTTPTSGPFPPSRTSRIRGRKPYRFPLDFPGITVDDLARHPVNVQRCPVCRTESPHNAKERTMTVPYADDDVSPDPGPDDLANRSFLAEDLGLDLVPPDQRRDYRARMDDWAEQDDDAR